MAHAIPAGDRTQTRRVAKEIRHPDLGNRYAHGALVLEREPQQVIDRACPHGRPGDRLWVRETTRAEELSTGLDGVRFVAHDAFVLIDNTPEAAPWVRLNHYRGKRGATAPPIRMPRWACRLVLDIVRVRIERLQAINLVDALAEGVGLNPSAAALRLRTPAGDSLPRAIFRAFREQINGANAWDTNPWVWVVEYRGSDKCPTFLRDSSESARCPHISRCAAAYSTRKYALF